MIPGGARIRKTGTATFLFLLFALSATCARADFADLFAAPGDIGAAKIPRYGTSRIAVVVISADPETAARSAARAFLGNELGSNTFRNYWNVNSATSYNPVLVVIERETDAAAPDGAPDSLGAYEWMTYVADEVRALVDNGALDPKQFDINGIERMPDGYMDGMIVIADGVDGAVAYPGDALGDIEFGGLPPGPFVLAGHDATDYELLRAFAMLIGFAPLEAGADGRGGVCLSLMGRPDAGMPLLDGYSRYRAGWARPVPITEKPRLFLLLPARASGEVYILGGEKEFFLIENRQPGGGYDTSIRGPGVAVYHVDETRAGAEEADVWRPLVMNEWPDGSFPLQTGERFDPDDALFRDDDIFASDYSLQNPNDAKAHSVSSNYNSGEPSDLTIVGIDTASHYPIISVIAGTDN